MPDQNYSAPNLVDDSDHELLFKAAYSFWILGQGGGSPVNITPPSIAVQGGGEAYPGSVLQGTAGTWSGSPTLTYQWQKDGSDIPGETSLAGYTVGNGDFGSSITLLEIPNGVVASGVSSNAIEVFDPEALGTLILWQKNTDLGEVGNTVENWINRADSGPVDVSNAGGSPVTVNDFLGPKMAFCQNATTSYLQSNGNLGWSGADFYAAIVLSSANVTVEGEANVLYMNSDSFEVFIANDETIGVNMGTTPYAFTDTVYPGSNTIFLLEVWRQNDPIHCAVNGVESAMAFTDSFVEANAPILIGNVEATAGIVLGELLFYDGTTASDRLAIRSYLMAAWGL